MTNKEIQILIIKYLNDFTTSEERELLITQLENSKVKDDFKKYLVLNNMIIRDASQFEYKYPLRKALEKIKQEQKEEKKNISIKNFIKYAAAVTILATITYFLSKERSTLVEPIIVNNQIKIGTDKAILTLDDGSIVVLEKGEKFNQLNVKSDGEKIVYSSDNDNEIEEEIAYNYLTIPRGGQFYIELADGTEIWLNSETKLKYPTKFINGKPRKVELIYGEAYFDVSPSTSHNGSKFSVISNEQTVQVIGTEFNIKAYNDDSHIYTTLVEGSVVLNNTVDGTILAPNQQAVLNRETKRIKVGSVDAAKIAHWKKGIFSFRGTSLREVTKVLSRWYDVDFVIKDEALYDYKFKGVLGKDQKIEEILTIIINSSKLSNYEIKDKTITIE